MESFYQDKGAVLAPEKNSCQEEFSKVDVRERKSSCCQRISIKLSFQSFDFPLSPLHIVFTNSIKNYENFLLNSKVSGEDVYNPFCSPNETTITVIICLTGILKISREIRRTQRVLSRIYRPNCA